VSPDDLAAVDRSWAQLRRRRAELVEHLETSFSAAGSPEVAAPRARWLVEAVAELVGLLTAPSRLGGRARRLAETWPVAGTAPCFGVEGQAWMRAARDVGPGWTHRTEDAWRHAWLLLSDVLAEEALSPFATHPATEGRPAVSPGTALAD
jgi:hypothetical protein